MESDGEVSRSIENVKQILKCVWNKIAGESEQKPNKGNDHPSVDVTDKKGNLKG